jgi:N-formylmaleamate deformylase
MCGCEGIAKVLGKEVVKMSNWFSNGHPAGTVRGRPADVIANGISIHYARTGGDKPPLVLAHGFSDDGLCWTPVAQALEGDYDMIMPDARGHGLSDAPETGYDTEDRVADLAGFIQALGLERPALMGHSMGANTVAFTAATYPDLVGCAVLEDPPWRELTSTPEETQARAKQRRAEIIERKGRTRQELIASCREAHPTWPEAELGPWADSKLQLSPNVLNRRLPPPTQRIGAMHWSEVAAKIACPTLLITADPDAGAIVTPQLAQEAAGVNANIRVIRISGAGHSIRREQFERYIQAVTEFLTQSYAA